MYSQDLYIVTSRPGSVLPLKTPMSDYNDDGNQIEKFFIDGVCGAFILSNVLSSDECATIINAAEAVQFQPDEPINNYSNDINSNHNGNDNSNDKDKDREGNDNSDDKTNDNSSRSGVDNLEWLIDNEMYDCIYDRVKPFLPEEITITRNDTVNTNRSDSKCHKLAGINKRFRLFRYGINS